MLKNVEFKSIFMGDGRRYIVTGYLDDRKVGKTLSLNESKFVHVLSTKEKFEYAEKLLVPLEEGRRQTLKMFNVVWMEGSIKHHQRVKAPDEKAAVEKIHSRGGSIVSLQEIN